MPAMGTVRQPVQLGRVHIPQPLTSGLRDKKIGNGNSVEHPVYNLDKESLNEQ